MQNHTTFAVAGTEVLLAAASSSTGSATGSLTLGSEGEPDATGHAAWRALPMLAAHLLVPDTSLCTATVLELGAGLGVPGLIAGRQAQRLILTDNNPEVLHRLAATVALNLPLMRASASVQHLEWGASHVPAALRGTVDVLLASDCVYSAEATARLLETAVALLAPGGRLLLSYVSRWAHVDRALAACCDGVGLSLQQLDSPLADLPWGSSLLLATTRAAPPPPPPPSALSPGAESVELCAADVHEATLTALASCAASPRQLCVRGCGPLALRGTQLRQLAASIAQWGGALETLNLAGHLLQTEETAAALAATLHPLRALRRLRLAMSELGAAGGAAVGGVLPGLLALEEIDAADCTLTQAGLAALCEGGGEARGEGKRSPLGRLRCLSLARNSVSCTAPLAAALAGSMLLTQLDLGGNELQAAGLEPLLAAGAAPPSLRHLRLCGNPLGSAGGALLGASLGPACLAQLEGLEVGRCLLGDSGVAALGAAMGGGTASRLALLRAPSNGLTDAGARRVAAALGAAAALEELDLSEGGVGPLGARALGAGLAQGGLRVLCMRGHVMGDEGLAHLAKYVPRMTVLRTLRVGGNGASAEAEAALGAAALPQCEVVGTPVSEVPQGAEGAPAWGV